MKLRKLLVASATLVGSLLTVGGALLGVSVVAAPAAVAASGSCGLRADNGATSVYAGDEQRVIFQVYANGGACNIAAGDAITISFPPGINPIPETALPGRNPSYDDGIFTCSWPASASTTQTATCVADASFSLAPGQAEGIHIPVIVQSGDSGAYTSTASGVGATGTMTLTVSQCSASTPLLDPKVAGGAIGIAGVAGLGLVGLRRRRSRRATVAN